MSKLNEYLSVESINNMSYPDFVALMKQDNTPPGSDYTIDFWIKNAEISSNSFLLDLACSTGYSSRECFLKTGSQAYGIDISLPAILVANEKAKNLNAEEKLKYCQADACSLPFDKSFFSHVLGGCNFAFIQDRDKALQQVNECLQPQGVLCVANFYYRKKIPITLINEVYKAINFMPEPNWTLEFWHDFFNDKFTLIKEENHELESQTNSELRDDIYEYIFERNPFTSCLNVEIKEVIFEKFLKIRTPLNKQRNYQGVTLQLWRKK